MCRYGLVSTGSVRRISGGGAKERLGTGNLGSERPRVKRKEPAVTELQPQLVQLIMEMLEIAELFGVLWIFPLKFLFLSC